MYTVKYGQLFYCPLCGRQEMHRAPRKWWMRLAPASKRLRCGHCQLQILNVFAT